VESGYWRLENGGGEGGLEGAGCRNGNVLADLSPTKPPSVQKDSLSRVCMLAWKQYNAAEIRFTRSTQQEQPIQKERQREL